MAYTFSRKGPVTVIKVTYDGVLEQDFLLTADRHWDNPHSDQEMQIKHLKQAVDREAGVLDFGDFFCAMQGKYDKRSSKACLRPEHQTDDYLDALVDTGIDFLSPYAGNLIRISRGNHETSIQTKLETDLIRRLCNGLNRSTGSKIHDGGYSGWIQFHFIDLVTKKKDVVNLWYIHGYGGGGPVTKGTIQSARRAAYISNAQIIVTGHVHEEWNLTVPKIELRPDGTINRFDQVHIQIPTYKDEYGNGKGGWSIECGHPPKPIGAKWLRFRNEEGKVTHDTLRAK